MTLPRTGDHDGQAISAAKCATLGDAPALLDPAARVAPTAAVPGPFPRVLPYPRLFKWALLGCSSILQQGLFAGAHFFANILLARWLAPASYGAFALAYSVFLLLHAFYMALFFEPIIVYGAGRYARSFSPYLRKLTGAHFGLLVPLGILFALAAPLFGRLYAGESQAAFFVLALAAPLLLFVWLCRAAFYARLNPHAGMVSGAGYFVLLILSLWWLRSIGKLSPASALAAMAAASVAVSVFSLRWLTARRERDPHPCAVTLSVVAADHWRYGSWASLTAIVMWIPGNIYYAMLSAAHGLESAATLRALINLVHPLLHTAIALVLLVIPLLVRKRERSSLGQMKRTVVRLIALFVPVGLLYLFLLTQARDSLLDFLYGDRYTNVSPWAIVAVGILPITGGVIGILGAGLRSLERTDLIFWSYVAGTVMAVAVGVPITMVLGFPAATISLVLGDLPTLAVLALCLFRCKAPTGHPA